MFKKILVPLDGTADSERVIDWVKPFARLGVDIHLVTIVDSRHLAEAYEFAQLTESITEWADQYLGGILKSVQDEFPSATSSRKTGTPAREILKVASEIDADLIAMEPHRGSAAMRGILGSCTDAIV
jgi:nucleotide-binding universal stress UspA family protein